ncbi:hypothetical protein ACFV4K_20055 [Nocardia sp. NPDC059764]|uniref:hypothetical protein n=1 Tax=Nocardia sp. NPDC059764 TaxID=3346939 RepID=UPI00364B59AF
MQFVEAAGRGSDGWTARFVLDAEVDLAVFHGMRESWGLANSYRSAMGSSVGAVANPQLPTYFGGPLDSIQLPNLAATFAPSEGMSKLMDGFAVTAMSGSDKWRESLGESVLLPTDRRREGSMGYREVSDRRENLGFRAEWWSAYLGPEVGGRQAVCC